MTTAAAAATTAAAAATTTPSKSLPFVERHYACEDVRRPKGE
eukprot:CAMPEP_0171553732 /NCGR_PEP_ID=MMETSP0960-20121227/9113_1 /TAXON_ID=87120 /ORGANISM="Aurantiochytrium limacinum, Strain ATCCMYA-1381" /LENGTH=41 /DNA_ID= /DNA_START= /DNA_END= /DNA_ORIENTATION=